MQRGRSARLRADAVSGVGRLVRCLGVEGITRTVVEAQVGGNPGRVFGREGRIGGGMGRGAAIEETGRQDVGETTGGLGQILGYVSVEYLDVRRISADT